MNGELVPLGGGDSIPLLKNHLRIGRRESCDIVLRFANVSAHHCELHLTGGYWYIKDMGSKNGVKVNGVRYQEKRLDPGDTLSIAKHDYEIDYNPQDLGAVGPPPTDEELPNDIFGKSLLERAGLAKNQLPADTHKRYDVADDRAGQIRDPNKPV